MVTSNFSLLQDVYLNVTALDHVLSAILFTLLIFTALGLIKYYLPEVMDKSFLLVASFAGLIFISSSIFFITSLSAPQFFLSLVLSLNLALCIFHPSLALANMVGFLILRPWELIENEALGVLPRALLLLFLSSLLIDMYRKRLLRVNLDRQQLGLLALGVWVFLSTLISGNVAEAQGVFFDGYFKSLVVAFMIFQAVRNHNDYKMVTGSVVIAVMGLSVYALFNTYFIAGTDRLEGRGAIQNANDLAAVLIFVVPLSLKSILKKEFKPWTWLSSAVVIFALAFGVWKAESRAAYLAVLLMGFTYVIYYFRHRKKLLVQFAAIALAGLAVVSQLNLGRNSSDLDESRMNRLGYWQAGISMALRNPILGVGFGQFPRNYQYYGAAEFTEHGERTAHSSWILLLSEAGFPALLLILFLFYKSFLKSWRIFKEAPELLLMLVGYGVCMSFLSHIYTLYPYILLALVLSFPQEVSHENPVA